MERKVSISIGKLQNAYGDLRAIEIAAEIGADAVDFDTCAGRWDYTREDSVYAKSDDEIISYFAAIKKRADELGIEIGQTHGRISGYTDNEEKNAIVVENARRDFLAAKTLGAPVTIIHSVSTCGMGPDTDPALMRKLNFEMFTRMLVHAKTYGVKIASETFGDAPNYGCVDFFGDIREFIMSYNKVCAVGDNADYFALCADTGHSNKATRFGNPSPADTIRMLGSNVTALHLNDNDTLTDQHKIPMTGCIDWNDVFNALDEIGYSGNYNMELNLAHFGKGFLVETAAFAIKVMRNFLKNRYGE
ncbi:MAG: sugar phosphate isomerase/epimerase [Clostridia bacterium]|nr:sugar phosphate isomerase/epimerase [Clostridia bacterium]